MLDSRGCGYSSPRSQRSGAGVIGVGGRGPARALAPWSAPFDAALLASETVGARLGGAEERGAPQHRLGRGRPPSWAECRHVIPTVISLTGRKRRLSRQIRGQTKAAWREARKVEAQLLEQLDRGEQRGSRTRTVTELVERWLEWRQQVRTISPVTVANREDRSSDRDPTATALTRLPAARTRPPHHHRQRQPAPARQPHPGA
jgi:hypothetical protein